MQQPNPRLEPTWPSARGQGAWRLRWGLLYTEPMCAQPARRLNREPLGFSTFLKKIRNN